MRTESRVGMFVIVLTAVLCLMLVLGNNTEAGETRARLEALVEEYIACCEAKSELRSSRSENIRQAATRSRKIAAFCKNAKAELVEAMLENNIEPKAYKVRYFLNARFHEKNHSILQAKE